MNGMPASRPQYTDFFDMPTGLRSFLLSPEYASADKTIQKTYGLTDEQTAKMGDALMDAVYGETDLLQAIASLKALVVPTPVPEAKWKEFLADILKTEVWRIRDLFGAELTQILNDNQIGTGGWPTARVILKPVTYSGAATEVAATAGFSLMGPQIRERMRELITSKKKGVRVDAQVREVLVRPADFGGIGLDPGTADKTLAAINQLIADVPIMSEDEYADWLAEESRKKTEPAPSSGPKTPEDVEIDKIKATMPVAPASVLDDAVEKTFGSLSSKPGDDYLAKRLRYIISSRFRDVRSAFELKQLLMRDSKVGGMGMTTGEADSMAQQIETAYATYHAPIMDEEKKKLETQKEIQSRRVEERKKTEAEEHAKWYQERILSRQQEEEGKKQLAEQFRQAMGSGAAALPPVEEHPMDVREQRKEKERFGELVPAVTVGAVPISAPASAPRPMAMGAAEAKPAVVPSASPFAPAPVAQQARPEVKISKETVALQSQQAASLKPRMTDVTPAGGGGTRLTGLAQELRQLGLADFRRQSADPEIAAQKIMQKIDTLGGESFEKKLEGIQAFQSSPLQKEYVTLVSDSFKKGRPVAELAEEMRKSGKDTLSQAEIAAIISLNSKLHY